MYTRYVCEYWDMMQNAFLTADCSRTSWKPVSMYKEHVCCSLLARHLSLSFSHIHSFINSIKNIRFLLCARHPTQGYRDTKTNQKPWALTYLSVEVLSLCCYTSLTPGLL